MTGMASTSKAFTGTPTLQIQPKAPEFLSPSDALAMHTWTIDLDITGVTPSTVPDAVLESTNFTLSIDRTGPTARYDIAAATSLAHPVLEYRYTTAFSADDDDKDQSAYLLAMNNLAERRHDLRVTFALPDMRK